MNCFCLLEAKQEAVNNINAATSEAGVDAAKANGVSAIEAIPCTPKGSGAPAKKGCGGSIATTSVILSSVTLLAFCLLISKKED